MKIRSLKISNILSFPHLSNFDEAPPTITFNDDLSILIGPNGSGKSNLIEVLNRLFKILFFQTYRVVDALITNPDTGQKAIQPTNASYNETLRKHSDFEGESSIVEIEMKFEGNDKNNIRFLFDNKDELNRLDKKYAGSRMFENFEQFKDIDFDKADLVRLRYIFKIVINQKLEIEPKNNDNPFSVFVNNYFINFNIIQKLIEISNVRENKVWRPLKNTFGLISSMRTYNSFNESFSFGERLNEEIGASDGGTLGISAKNYSGSEQVYQIALLKLAQFLKFNRDGNRMKDLMERLQQKDYMLYNVNESLKTLGLKIKLFDFNEFNNSVKIGIFRGENLVRYDLLSTGEKSIFFLVFALYGYDLQSGLLIIDEPELHLHPSLQRKYFEVILKARKEMDLQMLIATHSPVFVNEASISSTFRFTKKDGNTVINTPKKIKSTQRDLLRMLNLSNTSRIFFANKVIMVEGEGDEYFFRFFWDAHFKSKSNDVVEFLNIYGKGNFPKWRDFLNSFEINNFFIGDFDNVNNLKIPRGEGETEFEKYQEGISREYLDGIFILKRGDLEHYLGVKKDVTSILEFIDQFDGWVQKEKSKNGYQQTEQTKLEELELIFQTIESM